MAELVEATTRTGTVGGWAVAQAGHPVLRYHAIARHGGHGPELLHVALRTGEEVLPLFSSGGTARDFLATRDLDGTWYTRECYAGELVSLLLGLYAGVDGVLLDPVDGDEVEGYVPENFVYWESFVGYLLGDGQCAPVRPVHHRLMYPGIP